MAHFLAIGRYHEMIKMIHGTILKEKIDHYGGALDFPGKIGAELPDEDVIVVLPDLLEVHLTCLHHLHALSFSPRPLPPHPVCIHT